MSDETDTDSNTNQDSKRKYDDRSAKAKKLIAELMKMGIMPESIEVDGLKIKIMAYKSSSISDSSNDSSGLESATILQLPKFKSHRARAREEFAEKIRNEQ